MFLWQEICATRAQTSFLAASWEGASATGEWYVTSYNLGATMMIFTAVSKIYDDRNLAFSIKLPLFSRGALTLARDRITVYSRSTSHKVI
ncbi:hypothetical protein QUA43_14420 [Microcoleus sp. N9_B4]